MNIDQVKVGPRFRKDLGPIEDLAESISEVGLIQPIIVDQDGNLIAGRRRLAACKLLGWSDIPVVVAEGLRDAADRVQAERDENTCRKNMTASELVAIGLALEELERPKARARQVLAGERFGRGTDSSGSREPELSGRTSGVVGPALGMSRVTYERAKSVVLASQDAEAPEAVRDAAAAAVAEMDSTGKVKTAYNKVRAARKAEADPDSAVAEHLAVTVDDDRATNPRLHRKKAATILPRLLSQISGIAAAIQDVDFSDCVLKPNELSELNASVQVILAVRKTLKGNSQ